MLAQGEKKHRASQPTEPSQANWGVHTATPSAETFCQLTFREIIVNSCQHRHGFWSPRLHCHHASLAQCRYSRADLEYSAPGTWVISQSYIPRCKSSARPLLTLHRASLGCLSTTLLEPGGPPPRTPTGLGTGWGPEPGPASSQCRDTHRERAAGLLGLSEGQQKGGGSRAGDRARSCTQARTEHCQAEKS